TMRCRVRARMGFSTAGPANSVHNARPARALGEITFPTSGSAVRKMKENAAISSTAYAISSHADTWGILFKNPAQERSNARKFIVWPNRQQALSMPSVVRLERQFLTGRSASERRLPIDPRPCGLDLRRQAQHHRLIAISRDELDRDRQPSRRARSLHLTHREHDRWLARDVEPHSERGQRKYPAPILVHVFEHHVNPTELDRSGRRKSRR